ncbi:IQ motif and ubiquitin-like domain-containing protein [Anabrus simplex]|uniref:IQ motif and ubiquitin-like domain-containing protein n=1 Tax=Anabrus simplex TaxID=316456 RepID=UPI0035A3C69C
MEGKPQDDAMENAETRIGSALQDGEEVSLGNHRVECHSDESETHSWPVEAITVIKSIGSGTPTFQQETLRYSNGTTRHNMESPNHVEEHIKDTSYDIPEEVSEIEFEEDLRSKSKMHVLWAAPLVTKLDSNSVTVKFVLGPGKVYTRAYKIYCNIKEIKEDLSNVFKVPVEILCLTRGGELLEESLPLAGLGIEPYGSIELLLNTTSPEKFPLSIGNIYQEFSIPDVLTVRIETDKHDYKEIVVEIENRSIRKPFLGGYRHRQTGVEYHHAFSQTQPRISSVLPECKAHRDTQTSHIRNSRQNTLSDKCTQIWKQDFYIPTISDKVLPARTYVASQEVESGDALEDKVRIIQRSWRAYKMRMGVHRMSSAYRKYKNWESKERQRFEEERSQFQKQQLSHKTFPCTKSDFALLYNMVERWRTKELKRIAEMKPEAAKKAEFCALLEEEIQLLTAIEQHRIKLKEERLEKRDLQLINKCAEPIVWTGYKGLDIAMDTQNTQRARKLKHLYHSLCQEKFTLQQRLEVLFSLKYAINSYDSKWGSDIVSLLERESKLLLIGIKKAEMNVLRRRIRKMFLEFIKDPKFNPEMAKYTVSYQLVDLENKMFSCERCCKLLPYTQFSVNSQMKMAKYCTSCAWIENISGPRIDLSPYRLILRAVRRDEQKRHSHSSVAFIMQDQDMYFLIANIWQGHSAISESSDMNQLRLPRWDVTKDWSPWNCILITNEEMKYHTTLDNVEQSYDPDFIAEVSHRHTLAKIHFRHLIKSDQLLLVT